ncbi:MAG: FecR family protein [Pseudomonadota bacterium]|nr:FecR family protein [Pseudomonadota bacterium]
MNFFRLPGRVCLLLLFTALGWPPALAQDGIGSISRLTGGGIVTRLGQMGGIVMGQSLQVDDIVSSNAGSRIEISFVDGTRLTLGARALLRLDRYVFDPGGRRGRLAVFLQGAARFVSGRLGKSPNDTIAVSTAFGSIAGRGTDFWAGPIDGEYGVFLLDGRVEVANGAGAETLDEAGEGTMVVGPDAAPRAVTRWPAEKVDRALAAVAF